MRWHDALAALLAERGAAGDDQPTRDDLRSAIGVSDSSLYALFGASAAGSLLSHLRAEAPEALTRTSPYESRVDMVAAELKVCRYWPYREGWLEALADRETPDRWYAAKTLVEVVAAWAQGDPAVAAAVENAPPIAAVEDLMLLARRPAAGAAWALLRGATTLALAPEGATPRAVLDTFQEGLVTVGLTRASAYNQIAAATTEAMASAIHIIPEMPDDERARLLDELRPYLDELRKLADGA